MFPNRGFPFTPAGAGRALNVPWNPVKTMLAPAPEVAAAKATTMMAPAAAPAAAVAKPRLPSRGGFGWRHALIGAGLGGGMSLIHSLFGRNDKQAFMEGLQQQWHSLDPKSQLLAGTGAALAGAGGLHSMLSDNPGVTGPLLMAGGAGLGLYGLSGQNFQNVPQTLSHVLGGGQPASEAPKQPQKPGGPSTGLSLDQAADHPALQKFFVGGQPQFTNIVRAPDSELLKGVNLLNPQARQQLVSELESFKPSWAQGMAAKAMGLDIEAQRRRLLGILGQSPETPQSAPDLHTPALQNTSQLHLVA